MKNKCDCYHEQQKMLYAYHPVTGQSIAHSVDVGVCWGTKERDECSCGGCKDKCDFYPEVRARESVSVGNAIEHYKHGINYDIFSEPVTSYARLSVEALEKQIPKKVVNRGYFYGYTYHCPVCESQVEKHAYCDNDQYCRTCGQALDWSE